MSLELSLVLPSLLSAAAALVVVALAVVTVVVVPVEVTVVIVIVKKVTLNIEDLKRKRVSPNLDIKMG